MKPSGAQPTPPLSVLFVSGVAVGGAARSTRELAGALAGRGHDVAVLSTDRPAGNTLFGIAERVAIKSEGLPVLGELTDRVAGLLGRRTTQIDTNPFPELRSRVAENALKAVLRARRPAAVIVNSVPRRSARILEREARESGAMFALYVREAHALTHLTDSALTPDLVLANARTHCEALDRLGVQSVFVPSVVDVSAARVDSTRRSVLLVNPVEANRVDLIIRLATRRPDDHFVLQESWPLNDDERRRLDAKISGHENVELRPRTEDPRQVYRDARLVLATYPTGRPRVILEAQANGLPVIALERPALREVAGNAARYVDDDAPDDQWLEAIAEFDQSSVYQHAVARSFAHAQRPEFDPGAIVSNFEHAVRTALASLND